MVSLRCVRSVQDLLKENAKYPGTVFLSMFPHNLVDIMQREYSLYPQQKEGSLGIDIDKMDALTLLGIMLPSGYNRLPLAGFNGQNEYSQFCGL